MPTACQRNTQGVISTEGRNRFTVIPAKAGIHNILNRDYWISGRSSRYARNDEFFRYSLTNF
jgi:hypothetical protein